MPNSKRMDEINARLAEVIAADARLNDELSATPTVYDSPPAPELGIPSYRVYVDWTFGRTVLSEPQPRTAMQFIRLEHTLIIWLIVYHDDKATAHADYGKMEYNLTRILGDETDEDGYWFAGRMTARTPSARHPNIAATGDIRLRSGNIEFTILQELTI
jgi:hypothetical protein